MANIPFDRQTIVRCYNTEHEQELVAKDPDRTSNLNRFEGRVQEQIRENDDPNALRKLQNFLKIDTIKTIPLVVHIVYNTNKQNISDEQINSQITILNQDFSRTNPDASNTPSAFSPVAADTGIRFCLVKVIRHKTNVTQFSNNDDVKHNNKGGSDAVDTSRYFNVWVCSLGGNLLGYGEFPTIIRSNTYGVVVNYETFGTGGTSRPPYDKGRTLTHEIAHCLNVYHIFEESHTTSCIKTDKVYDIPTQSTPTYGCPGFPKTDNCSLNAPGIMFMNYMDYSDDACMNCFTIDQSKRMNATLETYPYNNLVKTGCAFLGDISELPSNQRQMRNKKYLFWGISILILIIVILFLIRYYRKN